MIISISGFLTLLRCHWGHCEGGESFTTAENARTSQGTGVGFFDTPQINSQIIRPWLGWHRFAQIIKLLIRQENLPRVQLPSSTVHREFLTWRLDFSICPCHGKSEPWRLSGVGGLVEGWWGELYYNFFPSSFPEEMLTWKLSIQSGADQSWWKPSRFSVSSREKEHFLPQAEAERRTLFRLWRFGSILWLTSKAQSLKGTPNKENAGN